LQVSLAHYDTLKTVRNPANIVFRFEVCRLVIFEATIPIDRTEVP